MREQIDRDGPGEMAYGDTVEVKAIRRHRETELLEASLRVYGRHTEVQFVETDEGIKPEIQHAPRYFSEAEEQYILAVATIETGLLHGWFPERIEAIRE